MDCQVHFGSPDVKSNVQPKSRLTAKGRAMRDRIVQASAEAKGRVPNCSMIRF
jgi:hypothetical protein